MPQPELLLILGLVVPLIVHACVMQRKMQRQQADLLRLNDILTRATRDQLAAQANASREQRDIQSLVERLDALECRSAGGRRIESAMRVARQGGASPALLKDLGLSEAEASLLMRLNSMQSEPAVDANSGDVTRSNVPREERSPAKPVAGQAASLARLLAGASAA